MNKAAEQFYLEKFKKSHRHFPQGEVSEHESPDFLVDDGKKKVGIEVTGFYRESGSESSPLQKRKKIRQKVIDRAQILFNSKGLASRWVTVHFGLYFHCKKSEVEHIAKKLADLAASPFPTEVDQMIWNNDETTLKDIDCLVVRNVEMPESHWSAPMGTFVPNIEPQQIQQILDIKSKLCEKYRKSCDELWLIIVMDRFEASSFASITQESRLHYYSHLFDSAYLFLYEHSVNQDPPLLLLKS
ncbi:MAG: hypothetical protein JWR50_4372 [Mucilaginibacter sp.]|nr:hypothetical protein [Mucilaginibacter sp.]